MDLYQSEGDTQGMLQAPSSIQNQLTNFAMGLTTNIK